LSQDKKDKRFGAYNNYFVIISVTGGDREISSGKGLQFINGPFPIKQTPKFGKLIANH
jgi:hypothetical protein